MYTQFFNLKQSPFSIAPDPRYLFMSERHREALAHLLYGIGSGGGFVLLTGEIGAGKTTVCRCFMEQIPDNCKLAYIFNPKLSVEELLLSICDEFGIELAPHGAGAVSIKTYVDAINRYLLESHAQSKNNVLIIDEAQNLSAEVLEQLRLLTNLETSERKLLQIILIGQPELRTMLARPELEQLAQRVIARYHLGSLSAEETGNYIEHRLAVAGATAAAPFPRKLMGQVHQLAKGVPRRINLLCDRALLGAYVENQPQVTRTILRRAAAEVFAEQGWQAGGHPGALRRGWMMAAAGVLAGAAISGAAAWRLMPTQTAGKTVANAPASAAAAPARAPMQAAPAGLAAQAPGPVPGGAAATTATAAALASPAAPPVAMPGGVIAASASSEPLLRELAALWGAKLADGDPCQAAAKQNLRCLQTKGGIDELRQLDRPVMLTLHDDPAVPAYVLLTALNGNMATLSIGGKQQAIDVNALAARFDGEFTTLWRAPRSWRDEVAGGARGPDVDWLAKRLSQLYGLKKPPENQPLDADLQRRLKEFQAAQHLKADGVAGPKTFIRLNQLGGSQEPRLLAGK
jgi:general secretion pathway protein A